jgi:pimeloyl-ACP methyl ester carboxylesterase
MNAFEFPSEFRTKDISTNGTTIHVRSGGRGPAVVVLHGYGETGDMWAPMAAELARDHTVVVPDLRGMGLSAKPTGGFDKKTQAGDIAGVLDALAIDSADLVTHDIGNMVGYAFAAQYPKRATRFVLIDAPLPGVGPWEEILKNPLLWHFRFGGPDMERLVAGRERIYLDRFWNEFSATPSRFSEAARIHYAKLYACQARCIRASCSSLHLIRMPKTTRPSLQKASLPCRCWLLVARNRSVIPSSLRFDLHDPRI